MSLVPLLVNILRDESDYHPFAELDHMLDDDFGFGIHPVEIFHHRPSRSLTHRRFSPYRAHQLLAKRAANRLQERAERAAGGDFQRGSSLLPTVGKDGFQVCMDVAQFKPNELTVKTVDNTVVVEGKHEERQDEHGLIERHFIRKYTLPKGYDAKDVISTVSSDGVLTVKAPPPPKKGEVKNERIVQIQHTGPAHLSVKAPEQESGQKNGVSENGTEKMETSK